MVLCNFAISQTVSKTCISLYIVVAILFSHKGTCTVSRTITPINSVQTGLANLYDYQDWSASLNSMKNYVKPGYFIENAGIL